jgi:hypothetical protein
MAAYKIWVGTAFIFIFLILILTSTFTDLCGDACAGDGRQTISAEAQTGGHVPRAPDGLRGAHSQEGRAAAHQARQGMPYTVLLTREL